MATKSIIFEEVIDEESICDVVSKIDEALNGDNNIVLYMSSVGGSVHHAHLLLHRLDEIPDGKLKIVLFGQGSSAAFELFIRAKTKEKEVLETAHSILHMYTSMYDYRTDLIRSDSVNLLNSIVEHNDKLKDFLYTCDISEDSIKAIFEGKDILIESQKIKECLEAYARR